MNLQQYKDATTKLEDFRHWSIKVRMARDMGTINTGITKKLLEDFSDAFIDMARELSRLTYKNSVSRASLITGLSGYEIHRINRSLKR